jgi:hypothetical protein
MTSQINYAAITTTYPVAGVDNDSQGFRDNFTAISAGLAVAKTELTALQTNAVLVANLTTNATVVNNMLGSTISNGLYSSFYGVYFDGGTVPTSANIDLNNGPVQKFTLSGASPTLTFINWPTSGRAGYIKVHVHGDGAGVRYPVISTSNSGTLRYDNSFPTNPITSTKGFTLGGESVVSTTITNPGSGYTTPASISFTGGSLITSGYAPVASLSYTVVSATIAGGSGGTGYAVGDTIAIGSNVGVSMIVSSISGGGATGPIATVSITTGGTWALPVTYINSTYPISSATGSGARLALSFGIGAITLTGNGDGYTTTPPTITITAPGGSGVTATATATLSSGTATKIKIIEAWSNNAGADVFLRYLGEY